MPKFDGFKEPKPEKNGKSITKPKTAPVIIDKRCKVCQSSYRQVIDQMLASGVSYSEIERQFEFAAIPRRSISNHKDKHLGYEEAAIRAVIERQAMMDHRNFEEGVERLVTKQAYLEVALQKAYDQLIDNVVDIPAADAVKIIEQIQKLESQHQGVAVDELRVQFNAFLQAVKEIAPQELWPRIRDRTHDLLKASGRTLDFAEAEKQETQELQEAEVVEPTDVQNP